MDGFPFVHRETLRFRDLEVGVPPARIGTKSFELEYELRAGGRVVVEARSVLVGYDYDRGESIPVPERWQRRLTE